jgi:AAT family amino acid transporter
MMAKSHEALQRSLSTRQVSMLAIGGVIGVGLFYGAEVSVKLAGPAVILDFLLCGILVAIVMRSLGEMTIHMPVSGSFSYYASMVLSPQLGFITAGMWWFYWVATVMSELAGVGHLVQFWLPSFPVWVPGFLALILFTGSNLLAVRVFGEIEFWFALLKVMAVALFMIFGLLLMFTGIFSHGHLQTITNLWTHGGFMPNGFLGLLMAMSLVVQAYSGIETLAVESGESRDPKTSLKKAFGSVTFRISVLYVGSMFIMLSAFPWTYLLHHAGSPYVLMFSRVGIPLAATVINALIISSGLSSCDTGLYGGSRMLYSLSLKGMVSQRLGHVNTNRVPNAAIWATALAILVGIVITYLAPNQVYVWITSASAFADLFIWGVIIVSEIQFRRQLGRDAERRLEYPVPAWPTIPVVGLLLLVGIFAAFLISPLTRVSVWAGILFLVAMVIYAGVLKRRNALAQPEDFMESAEV